MRTGFVVVRGLKSLLNDELLERRPWLKQYDAKMPWTLQYPLHPAWELLRNSASAEPEQPATWFYGTTMTYIELYRICIRLSNKLVELGIKKGDLVGIMLPNSPQFVIAYWSLLMTGAIVVNVNPQYPYEELHENLLNLGGLTGLFTFDAVLPVVKRLNETNKFPVVIATRMMDFVNGQTVSTAEELQLEEGWYHLSELIESSTNTVPLRADLHPEDPAVIQFTGGTTGVPKGAVLTQHNLVAAAIIVDAWGLAVLDNLSLERRKCFCTLPYFHVYGQCCCILYSTYSRSTQVLMPRFIPNEIIDTLNIIPEINYWPCVPTMLQAILYNPRVNEIDYFRKFHYLGTGAAPCPMPLIEKARALDITYTEGWGMSETCALGVSSPAQGKNKPGGIGVPMADYDIRLVDPDTLQDVPRGEPGEIWIKGPTVMQGFWNNPEETKKTFFDGWLRTGDIAYFDEDYYLFIVDRTKDIIIAGGFNIYPQDIDAVLYKHPKIKDAISIGVPDEYRGETVKSFIQLVDGETVTVEEIIAFCKENLAGYKVPTQIEFREELPRTETGKAVRRKLRAEEMAKIETSKEKR